MKYLKGSLLFPNSLAVGARERFEQCRRETNGSRAPDDKLKPARKIWAHLSVLPIAALLLGSTAQARAADDQQANAPQVKVKKKVRAEKVKRSDAAQLGRVPPVPMTEEQATVERLKAIQKRLGFKGWTFDAPPMYDSLLMDAGGWRTKLAESGIGFVGMERADFATNLLNVPRRNPDGSQAYWGQKNSGLNEMVGILTLDTEKFFGISGGLIEAVGVWNRSSMPKYSPDAATMSALLWRQSLFNDKLVVAIGYMNLAQDFVGPSIGGVIFSPFGSFSTIAPANGAGYAPLSQPAVEVTWNITDNFYTKAAVGRSTNPSGPVADLIVNPTQATLFPQGTGQHAVVMDEWGYKQKSAPNTPYFWARVGGIYNNSTYKDYSQLLTGGTRDTTGMYALADYQFLQFDPSSPAMAHRGLYVGASFNYGPPETNLFSQYYEGRFYIKGPWASRPADQFNLSYSHITLSKDYVNFTNMLSPQTGTFAPTGVNNIVASYTARITRGVYLTTGLGYTDKPAIPYRTDTGSSLNFLSSLFIFF